MKISKETLARMVNDIVEELQNELLETPRLPDAIKKARKKERSEDTKERERDNERELKKYKKKRKATHGTMDDIMDDFRTFANGIMEDEELEEERKKKPACGGVRGSALYHDENGHFTGKDDAVVRSLKKYTGTDCRHGTTRVKGKNDSIATGLPCGSKEQTKAGGEGKHDKKCKGS